MNEQMKKILQQQQEYEYLKKSPSLIHLPNNLFCSSFLTTTVFPYIKSAVQKRKWQKRQNPVSYTHLTLPTIYSV